jgi:hypothetical protein
MRTKREVIDLVFTQGRISIYEIKEYDIGFMDSVEFDKRIGTDEDTDDKYYKIWEKKQRLLQTKYEEQGYVVTEIDGWLYIIKEEYKEIIQEQKYL